MIDEPFLWVDLREPRGVPIARRRRPTVSSDHVGRLRRRRRNGIHPTPRRRRSRRHRPPDALSRLPVPRRSGIAPSSTTSSASSSRATH
ncbi:hypothetical protein D8S78_07065 [Natrialba swarupiae]|nr:hypothetical protein [Natrialba swarupiae]